MIIEEIKKLYMDIAKQKEMNYVYGSPEEFSNLPLLDYQLTDIVFPYLLSHGGKEMGNGGIEFFGNSFYPFSDGYDKNRVEQIIQELGEDGYDSLMNLELGYFNTDDLETRLSEIVSNIELEKSGKIPKFDEMSVEEFKDLFETPKKSEYVNWDLDKDTIKRAILSFPTKCTYGCDVSDVLSEYGDEIRDAISDDLFGELNSDYLEQALDRDNLSYTVNSKPLEKALENYMFLSISVGGKDYILPAVVSNVLALYEEDTPVTLKDLGNLVTFDELADICADAYEACIIEYESSYATKYHEATWGYYGGEPPYWDTEDVDGEISLGSASEIYLKDVLEYVSGADSNPQKDINLLVKKENRNVGEGI